MVVKMKSGGSTQGEVQDSKTNAGDKTMEKNKAIGVSFKVLILNFIKCFVPMSKELCRLEVKGVISYFAFHKYRTVLGR